MTKALGTIYSFSSGKGTAVVTTYLNAQGQCQVRSMNAAEFYNGALFKTLKLITLECEKA